MTRYIRGLNGDMPWCVVITNMIGTLKYSVEFTGSGDDYEIFLEGLEDGLYLVTILSGKGRQTVKLIISRKVIH